jgi:hypothetical protein
MPQITPAEVLALTTSYADAVRELRDALDQREDILRELRRQRITPNPNHFTASVNRIHAARKIVAALKAAIDATIGTGEVDQ